ncbi:MAG: pseudouridine-5'-phosphate glycosidase [Spirochaetota bacterium]
MMSDLIKIKKEVKEALDNSQPVISLESTIISHGMPYPDNVETALKLEEIAYNKGVIPATIAIIDGIIHIGLEKEEIEKLAKAENVAKVSRRDFPYVISHKLTGATTVAGTMIASNMVGIKVFATGGIGGVHRGAELSFDISADLREFSLTPVVVVSAGAKAILDLNKTMEVLESFGINVLGYKTQVFPAFYSQSSGIKLNTLVNNPKEIAETFKASLDMGFESGLLIANPIPKEDEIPNEVIEDYINTAINEMKKEKISGKDTTPYLLSKIVELSDGKSLKANISLVKNNVALASEVSKELTVLQFDKGSKYKL